jgi:hypothetical protein
MKLWMFLVVYGIAKTIHRMPGGNYVPLSQNCASNENTKLLIPVIY